MLGAGLLIRLGDRRADSSSALISTVSACLPEIDSL